MTEIYVLILAVGVIAVALIYLWGMRGRGATGRHRKAARLPENEPVLDTSQPLPEVDSEERHYGEFGAITAEHPLAQEALVDVEITPVRRTRPAEQTEATAQPAAPPEPAAAPPRRPVAPAESQPRPAAQPRREKKPAARPQMTVLLTVMPPAGGKFQGPQILRAAHQLDLKLHKTGVFDCLPDASTGTHAAVFGVAHLREPGTFDLDTIRGLQTPGLLVFMHLPGPLEEIVSIDMMVAVAQQLAQKLGGTICDEHRKPITTEDIMRLRNRVLEFERHLRAQPANP